MSGTLVFLREGYKRTSRCQRRRGSNLGRRLGVWLKEPLGFDLSEMKYYLRFKIIVCLTFLTLSLTTRLIQKICTNIVKFKSFLKILY